MAVAPAVGAWVGAAVGGTRVAVGGTEVAVAGAAVTVGGTGVAVGGAEVGVTMAFGGAVVGAPGAPACDLAVAVGVAEAANAARGQLANTASASEQTSLRARDRRADRS